MARKSTKAATSTTLGNLGIAPYEEKKGEEYMNVDHKDHFRTILETWKKQLMEEVDRTVNHMQDEAANFPDPVDRAGIAAVFPLESAGRYPKLMVTHFSDELTVQDVSQRVVGFCERQGFSDFTGRVGISDNNGTGTTTREGRTRPLAGHTFVCIRS